MAYPCEFVLHEGAVARLLPRQFARPIRSITSYSQNFYEDLRRAARLLALVGLVTRLQHWTQRFVEQLNLKSAKVHKSGLANQLEALNKKLGIGPVPVLFFENLAEVRNSIIHGDSRAEWDYNGKIRRVVDEYLNAWKDVELTEEQLKDAIEKATEQVIWYDKKLHP